MPQRTPLFSNHEKLGARFVDFHGWEMPIQYEGIIPEHRAVREAVGMFDVSHMGLFRLTGAGVPAFFDQVFTQRASKARVGRCLYTHILKPDGGILDDMVFARAAEEEWFTVPNASMIGPDYAWLNARIPVDGSVKLENLSDSWSILALQGPKARDTLEKVLEDPGLAKMRPFRYRNVNLNDGTNFHLQSTGYTGERGYELILPSPTASQAFDALMAAGEEFGIKPIGLGARDTLRLEKGYLLSGQDFDGIATTMETCRTKTCLDWDHEFIGKDVLEKQRAAGDYDRFVNVKLEGKGVPRPGMKILRDGEEVGELTSGTMSPSLGFGIGLGYVKHTAATVGTKIQIQIRNRAVDSVIAEDPFL